MLVLGRNVDQSFLIAHPHGTIKVMLVESRPGKARIGIEAPRSVQILREELVEEAHREIDQRENRSCQAARS